MLHVIRIHRGNLENYDTVKFINLLGTGEIIIRYEVNKSHKQFKYH